jgi:hypothetical protein
MGTSIVEGGGKLMPIHWNILSSALQSGRKGECLSWSRLDAERTADSTGIIVGPVLEKQVNTVTGSLRGGEVRERRSCWLPGENL